MSFGMMTALGGSGSSYGGSSLSGGSSSSWTSFNWYNWDKNKSFWKNLRENFNRGFRGRLGDGRELVGLERNRSFDPTNFDFYSHFGDMKDHPPIIFVELFNRPAGFKEQEYLNSLKERLVENGFNQNLKVVRSSIKWRFKSWLYGLPSATITFRPFQVKDISLAFESGGLVAGFAQYYSNKAVVYPGLNYSSALRDRVFSTNWYVMATMHELGHAIFGFKHTNQGIMQPKLIDPYLNFLPWQQEIIRKSIWGQ